MLGLLLLPLIVSGSYPDCSNPSSYSSYPHSTSYKGLQDNVSWDRIRGTSNSCNLTQLTEQPFSCGDCDFDLNGDEWYRFNDGPYDRIVEWTDPVKCPEVGTCNGHSQITLAPTNMTGPNSSFFGLVISNNKNLSPTASQPCYRGVANDTAHMVEMVDCTTFSLYRFPKGAWEHMSTNEYCNLTYTNDKGTNETIPMPTSLCMDEKETLVGNMIYVGKGQATTVQCTATRSPTPPTVTWSADGADVTSSASRDPSSSTHTLVYNLEVQADDTWSVLSCHTDSKSWNFSKVWVEAGDSEGSSPLTTSCLIHIPNPTEEGNIYLTRGLEKYYPGKDSPPVNYTMTLGWQEGCYNVTLTWSGQVGSSARNSTEKWGCSLEDPYTGDTFSEVFDMTLVKHCPGGSGFLATDTSCSMCPAGTRGSGDVCESCQPGAISPNEGSEDCSLCDAGYIPDANSVTCVMCGDNTFSAVDECKDCEAGSVSRKGAGSCEQCAAGTYQSGGKCTPCAPGSVSPPGSTSCSICPSGTSPDTDTCTPCNPGYIAPSPGSPTCSPCPDNTFSSSNTCEPCPDGQTAGEGAGACHYTKHTEAWKYVVLGVGVALLLVALLVAGTVIRSRRGRRLKERRTMIYRNNQEGGEVGDTDPTTRVKGRGNSQTENEYC